MTLQSTPVNPPGFVKIINTRGRKKLSEEEKKDANKLRLDEREENSRMVTGTFKNLECAGGDATVTYHRYKEDSTEVYHFLDGEERTIKLGVAKQINEDCKYMRKIHNTDILQKGPNGDWTPIPGKPIERYQFISTDFS